MAVGYTSGFPISASLTAGLRKANICSRSEAERLLCFTNNASPLFMLVAVGVGMFSSPRLGIIIALSHYSANFLIGLLLRFYKKREAGVSPVIWRQGNILGNAVSEMKKAYLANPRPFGKMLGDAITTSVTKLLLIGGFVIMFSIVIKISCITGIMSCLTKIIGLCCMPLGFSDSIISSIGWGFFEITLGAKAAAGSTAPLAQKAVAASIILGWSGVSVLAQVAAMISGTDLRMGLFALSRLFHSIIAGCTCYFLLRCRTVLAWLARPVSSPDPSSFPWLETLLWYSGIFLYTMGVLGLLALLVCLVRSVYSKY
jgi:sporulation integral membrane protein YlbJ